MDNKSLFGFVAGFFFVPSAILSLLYILNSMYADDGIMMFRALSDLNKMRSVPGEE